MKQRVISALVGLVLLAVVFLNMDNYLLNGCIAVISVIAVSEMLRVTDTLQYKSMCVPIFLVAAVTPFVQEINLQHKMPEVAFFLLILFFVLLLRHHQTIRFEQCAMMLMVALVFPLFFSCAVYIRNRYGPELGGFYLFWALGAAWMSDTGAYFTGRAFGKHKLAPQISPKKTVEGFWGGLATATICMLVLAKVFEIWMSSFAGLHFEVNYLAMALITPLLSAMGVLGDLSASVIKRQHGVKDYGTIMPGHGGVMDRFDSALFTVPTVYVLVGYIDIVTLIV
jgi:CDP-diglyceride synthetase